MTDSTNESKLLNYLALSLLQGVDVELMRWFDQNNMPAGELLTATEAELKALPRLPKAVISTQKRYGALEQAKSELEYLRQNNIRVSCYDDADYPTRLLDAQHAPIIVYRRGNLDLNGCPTVGIVGTRHADTYGTAFTRRLVEELAQRVPGLVTVSGLAYGIDIAAHEASLAVGVPTVAVVGHGLDRVYPAAHRDTACRIIREGGVILSDYPHDTRINNYNFLERNRLVAALSDALVVVESGKVGGALATARLARKSGRRVFALPGRITDNYSSGCNDLLVSGNAQCLTSADDLIKAMPWDSVQPQVVAVDDSDGNLISTLTPEERKLLRCIITVDGCDNDLLVEITDMPASKIMTVMTELEMRGLVSLEPGNRYRLLKTINPDSLLLLNNL